MTLSLIEINEKLHEMLTLQNELNTLVNPEWAKKRYKFGRYSAIELSEAHDHLGYKHWKKQPNAYFQFELEIIDVLHFYLSLVAIKPMEAAREEINSLSRLLYNNRYNQGLLNSYISSHNENDKELLQDILDEQMIKALQEKENPGTFDHDSMADLLINGLIYESEGILKKIRSLYVPKNCLNIYRNKNGYQGGTYTKIYNGKEDNEYLEQIINEMPDADAQTILHQLSIKIPQGA